jgi:murein DD-endopeptidase MepM/ murein hydrolase activator NlpD
MARICVTPENLRSLSASINDKNVRLQGLEAQLRNLLNGMDWETRQKANVDAEVSTACKQARNLAAQADALVLTLRARAQAFEQADRQSAEQLGALDDSIRQFMGGISSGQPAIHEWLKERWPFLTISFLSIPFIPLLKNILWPPKVIHKSDGEMSTELTGSPKIICVAIPKPPLTNYKINPDAKFPKYADGEIHNGIDIWPDPKDKSIPHPIHPIGPGKVVEVATQYGKDEDGKVIIDGYGHYVVIEHTLQDGTKAYSRYAHLAEPSKLTEGQTVGTLNDSSYIGIMGSTGKSTGLHLHLEVWSLNEKGHKNYMDPEPVILGNTQIRFNEFAE